VASAIRQELIESQEPLWFIGQRYGTTESVVSRINKGTTWKGLGPPPLRAHVERSGRSRPGVTPKRQTKADLLRTWVAERERDECWIWQSSISHGYGTVLFNGRMEKTHRAALLAEGLAIPKGKVVRHVCPTGANKACCNPEHLRIGTYSENMIDAYDTGALGRAENHHTAKLSLEDAKAIRQALKTPESNRAIAKRFAVSETLVSQINTGKAWPQLGPPVQRAPTTRIFTDEEVLAIRARCQNESSRSIAADLGCAAVTIWRIKNRKRYGHVS